MAPRPVDPWTRALAPRLVNPSWAKGGGVALTAVPGPPVKPRSGASVRIGSALPLQFFNLHGGAGVLVTHR